MTRYGVLCTKKKTWVSEATTALNLSSPIPRTMDGCTCTVIPRLLPIVVVPTHCLRILFQLTYTVISIISSFSHPTPEIGTAMKVPLVDEPHLKLVPFFLQYEPPCNLRSIDHSGGSLLTAVVSPIRMAGGTNQQASLQISEAAHQPQPWISGSRQGSPHSAIPLARCTSALTYHSSCAHDHIQVVGSAKGRPRRILR